jgi:hypothetical protein
VPWLRSQAAAEPSLLQKLGRVLKEKAAGDYERYIKGTSKTRERLGLVEELLTFWSLEDYESTLEELEEALIVSPCSMATCSNAVQQMQTSWVCQHSAVHCAINASLHADDQKLGSVVTA